MMLFAISDPVWLAILGVVSLLIKEYFDRVRSAANTAQIKADVGQKLEVVGVNVQKIETATNSMKDALILATEKEALQRGAVDERARADAAAGPPVPPDMLVVDPKGKTIATITPDVVSEPVPPPMPPTKKPGVKSP